MCVGVCACVCACGRAHVGVCVAGKIYIIYNAKKRGHMGREKVYLKD